MNFCEIILNWILNWIIFWRNSNIELNQFGYRSPLFQFQKHFRTQKQLCFNSQIFFCWDFVHFHNCKLVIVGVLLLSYSGFMFCSMHVGAFNMGGLGISSDSGQGQNNFGQKNFKNDFQRTQRRSSICPELGTSWMGDQLNGSSITWWSSWPTGMSYLTLNLLLSKNIAHVGSFKHFVIFVFLCLHITELNND